RRHAPFPMGHYTPQRILRAGATGAVFLCQHRASKAPVLVQTLHPDVLDRDAAAVLEDAKALQAAPHPGLLAVREAGFADGDPARPYLVQEYFEGQTLLEYVQQHGALSMEQCLLLMPRLAEALQAAHAHGVLHRGLNPGGVLVRRDEQG